MIGGGHISNSQPTDFSGFWPVGRAPEAGSASLKRLNCPPTTSPPPHHFQFKSDWPQEIRFQNLENRRLCRWRRRGEIGCSVLRAEVTCQSLIGGGIARYWAASAVCSYIVQLYCAVILGSCVVQLYWAAKSYIVQHTLILHHVYCVVCDLQLYFAAIFFAAIFFCSYILSSYIDLKFLCPKVYPVQLLHLPEIHHKQCNEYWQCWNQHCPNDEKMNCAWCSPSCSVQ